MLSRRSLTPSRTCASSACLPARAIREGDFNRVDLTLLSIDEQKLPIYLQMRRMPLCDNKPWPGEPVIVAIPEGSALSHYVALVASRPLPKGIFHGDPRCRDHW
jgi:hypothetical protein